MSHVSNDGVTHINIYSKGKTKLGQALSHFSHHGFNHPHYGHFASLEAFWYYVRSGCKHEELKELVGLYAKKIGRAYPRVERSDFMRLIHDAAQMKIEQNPNLLQMVLKSALPFEHYYVDWRNGKPKPFYPKGIHWLAPMYDQIRKDLIAKYGSIDYV
jgi:hypothetical protein